MHCCCILQNGQRSSLPALWWVNDSGVEVRWSFEELGFHSRRLANVLHQECSLERGDRVFLILPRVPEWWLVNVACLRTGTVSQSCSNMFSGFIHPCSVSLSSDSFLELTFNLLLLINTYVETIILA